MGKRSLSVHNTGVFSFMLSTITAVVSFLIPPNANPNSMLGTLRTEVRQIVGLTRRSQHHELVEFGEYVNRLVQQLVSALENDQLTRQANVIKNLEQLQKTLLSILQRISSINDAGGLTSRRHLRFPEEDYISQMRQQLEDALSAFQFGAALGLLLNSNARAGVPDPPQQTPQPCDIPPLGHHPRQASQPVKPPQHDRIPHPRPAPQFSAQQTKPEPAPPAARPSPPETAELSVAFMNVERCRRSLKHSHSSSRVTELASALGRLSLLLEKAGRTREALEASQKSAELYRSLVEWPH